MLIPDQQHAGLHEHIDVCLSHSSICDIRTRAGDGFIMADVKDILGVPRGIAANLQQDAPKTTKERMQRPAGMSREAFALLDGSHPIPPSHLAVDLNKKAALAGLKQKRKFSSKGLSTYQFRPFTNPARKDGLVLRHWVKCFKDTAGKLREADETYPFAKFNKQVRLKHTVQSLMSQRCCSSVAS